MSTPSPAHRVPCTAPSGRTGVLCSRAFFELQLAFARKVAALSGLPLQRALLDHTNLYIRFGLGRAFDPAHPRWSEYLAGLAEATDPTGWTHRFYLAHPAPLAGPDGIARVGCFSCSRLPGGHLRLHFENAEPDGHSPLARDRAERRRAELRALFAPFGRAGAAAPTVVGTSWLYNLEAYRRLFPRAYLATARPITGRFRHMPLWGQFLDRRGEVREPPARQLLERLDRQTGLDDLDGCFPFPVLRLETSAAELCRAD